MAKGVAFDEIDLETVAQLLGVSTRQITNYINHKGLPSQGSGKTRRFIWADVREWYVDYRFSLETGAGSGGSDDPDYDPETSDSGGNGKEDIRAANLRKTRAEANLKELQLGKLRGQVISIPDAKVRLDRVFGNMRAKLLGIAPKLANRLAAERDPAGRQAVVQEEMESLCREIATGAVVDMPTETDDDTLDEISAAAQIDTHVLGHVFRYTNPRVAIREANDVVRAARELLTEARDFRDRVKDYFRARD